MCGPRCPRLSRSSAAAVGTCSVVVTRTRKQQQKQQCYAPGYRYLLFISATDSGEPSHSRAVRSSKLCCTRAPMHAQAMTRSKGHAFLFLLLIFGTESTSLGMSIPSVAMKNRFVPSRRRNLNICRRYLGSRISYLALSVVPSMCSM